MVIFLLTAAVCYSQDVPENFLSGGRKSETSRIQHLNPLLYPNSDKEFLLVWDEYQNDSLTYHAQLFDSLGNPIGQNFPIFSSTLIAFAPDSSFFVEQYKSVDIGGPYFEIDFIGYLCKLDGTWSLSFFDRGGPMTGSDCVGIYCAEGGYDLLGSADGYINLSGDGGRLSFSASDWSGNVLWGWNPGQYPDVYVTNYSATFGSEGGFAAAWLNAELHGPSDTLKYNVMGSFFDKNGDTLATNVVLSPETGTSLDPEYWRREKIRNIPLMDSLYEIFDYDADSFVLTYWKVDHFGHLVGGMNEVEAYHDTSATNGFDRRAGNFALTPILKGRFSAVITSYDPSIDSPRNYNSVLNFDGKGDQIGVMLEDTTINFRQQKSLFATPDSLLLIPAVKDSDIYLNAYQALALKWSKKVNDDLVRVTDIGASPPTSFMLYQSYPNPFNPATVISYQLPAVSRVALKVFDILGREIATLVDARENAGYHEVKFDGSRLASGVYFVRLTAGTFSATRKVLLMK